MGLRRLCPVGERLAATGENIDAHARTCPSCASLSQFDAAKGADGLETQAFRPSPPPDTPPQAHPLPGLFETSVGGSAVATTADPGDSTFRLLKTGRFGRYRVESLLGRGGMGAVVKAYDPVLDRTVAIKVLHSHLGGPGANAMFLQEARAAAGIHSDHVVPVYTFGEENGTAYLVMQYCPGGSLQTRLDRPEPFARDEILDVARQAARGLAAAHARGLVHRDVKPANLLIEPLPGGGRRVRVTDFGLAHAAAAPLPEAEGLVAGTPAYMPPEQAKGRPVDARSDLYSLGVILFQMATGRLPFVTTSPEAVLRMHLNLAPPAPSTLAPGACAPDLETLILDLLRKDPADRPQSAEQVLARLDVMAGGDRLTTAERARLSFLRGFKVMDHANRGRPDPNRQAGPP